MIVEKKYTNNNEKALRETQTLHAGGSKREPKYFAPRRPLPGGVGRSKFKSIGDGHYLYLQTQFYEDRRINSELSW